MCRSPADQLVLTAHRGHGSDGARGRAAAAADDLALATVLKSPPLFGLDDEDLFKIAWERKTSLRTALRARRRWTALREGGRQLDRFAQWAHKDTPFWVLCAGIGC
jgi:ATP-dependent helicase/nuclease subunit A